MAIQSRPGDSRGNPPWRFKVDLAIREENTMAIQLKHWRFTIVKNLWHGDLIDVSSESPILRKKSLHAYCGVHSWSIDTVNALKDGLRVQIPYAVLGSYKIYVNKDLYAFTVSTLAIHGNVC